MQSVADQVIAFLLVMCLGFFVGFVFDCYRILRQILRLNHWGTIIGDFIFWIVITCFSYAFLLWSNWGEVRIYVFLAIGIGVLCYLKIATHKVQPVLFKIYRMLGRVIQPFKRIILKICSKMKKKFKKI